MEKKLPGEYSVISVEEINTILNNYRIGKKPLAKLLGWGETTIIRYIEGDIPTVEYSDKLKMILDNPSYFYEILLKNHEKVTSVAYRKSRKAVLKKLMESKISIVAQYLINLYEAKIDISRLESLLYYIQGFSLALHNVAIFEDEYIINSTNMPYPKLSEEFGLRPISMLELEESSLSDGEKILIHTIVDAFDWYGPKTIQSFVKLELSKLRISRDKQNQKIITIDTLKNYFKELISNYGIEQVEDISKYPDQLFLEIKQR